MQDQYVEVEIFGEKYKLISDSRDVERIQNVAKLVDDKMNEMRENYPNFTRVQLAVLAALNLVDELLDVNEHYETFDSKVNRVLESIEEQLQVS